MSQFQIISKDIHPTQRGLECSTRSSPISRIPFELLTEILRRVALIHFEEEKENPSLRLKDACRRPFAWSQLSRVCHLWYDVLLHTPALWCYIRVTPHVRSETIRKILPRSHQMPLSIVLDYESFVIPHDLDLTLAVLRSQRHRIRTLELSTCGAIYAASFSQFLAELTRCTTVSRMQKLTLNLVNSHMYPPAIDSMCHVLSRDSLPQLSDLTMLGITWNASMFRAACQPGLRFLTLSGAVHWDVSPLVVLSALEYTDSLQYLHIDLRFARCQDTPQVYDSIVTSRQPKLRLSQLRELTIAFVGYGYASATLLTMINVPEICHTAVSFHGIHPSKRCVLNTTHWTGQKSLSGVEKETVVHSTQLTTPCTDDSEGNISFSLWRAQLASNSPSLLVQY